MFKDPEVPRTGEAKDSRPRGRPETGLLPPGSSQIDAFAFVCFVRYCLACLLTCCALCAFALCITARWQRGTLWSSGLAAAALVNGVITSHWSSLAISE